MTLDDLRQLVADIQARQMELDSVEVKAARGGTPKLQEVLSAFANRTGGGVVLCGLDERTNFGLVGVQNAQRLQEEVAHLATDGMEPALRPTFTVDEIDGRVVVAIEVDEVQAAQKPCFYKAAGLPKGAYLRVGNTNRQMSEYEVFGYLSGRGQPEYDAEVVGEATLDDLDADRLAAYLAALRRTRPSAAFLTGDRVEVLRRLHVVAEKDGSLHPTLAGLLAFGRWPQEFFSQLRITFLHYYGTDVGEKTPQGARFLDNRSFEGPLSAMIEEAETYVMSALRKASLIEGMLRRDIPEYPLDAVREAIANAVAHRDYSPYVRGSYIQIRLFADRIEVQSPGGLFGNVNIENLEDEHSTRNARLMRILEDLRVVENRGSGIESMLQSLREANLEPPRFDDRRSSFWVTFRNHSLMNPSAIAWLNLFAQLPLSDRQRLALVYLRQRGQIANADYRRLNHVDPLVAGQELRGLVQQGLVAQDGVGRGTTYRLLVDNRSVVHTNGDSTLGDAVVALVRARESVTSGDCQTELGLNKDQAYRLLNNLVQSGRLKAVGEGRWRRYTLP